MGMAPVTHVLFTRLVVVYVVALGLFASLDLLKPAFSTPIRRARNGSTVIVLCFLMGMHSLVSSSVCLTVSSIRFQSCVRLLDLSVRNQAHPHVVVPFYISFSISRATSSLSAISRRSVS